MSSAGTSLLQSKISRDLFNFGPYVKIRRHLVFEFRSVLLPTNQNSNSRGSSPRGPLWGSAPNEPPNFLNFGPGELPLGGLKLRPYYSRTLLNKGHCLRRLSESEHESVCTTRVTQLLAPKWNVCGWVWLVVWGGETYRSQMSATVDRCERLSRQI